MNVLVNLMIKIILMVGLGLLLKKTKVITAELQKGISNLLVTAVLPLNIIASSKQELTQKSLNGTIFVAVFAFIYYIASIVVLKIATKRMKLTDKGKNLMLTMCVFANVGFMGFPLVEEMYGNSSIIYAVIFNLFYQIFFYTYGMYLLSTDGKSNILTIFKTPVTISSFLCVVLFLAQVSLPDVVQSTFTTVGSMTVPLSMIIIGCSIADMKLMDVIKDKYSYFVSVMRLIIFPLAAYVILKVFHLSGDIAGLCLLLSGLPSGSLNVIVAQQQDCEPELAAKAVVQSMIYMVISLPILFWLVQTL